MAQTCEVMQRCFSGLFMKEVFHFAMRQMGLLALRTRAVCSNEPEQTPPSIIPSPRIEGCKGGWRVLRGMSPISAEQLQIR